jgi:hypothetical protein
MRKKPEDTQRGGVRHIPDVVAMNRAQAGLMAIDQLGLTTNNMLTDEEGYEVLVDNSGEILFAGDIS